MAAAEEDKTKTGDLNERIDEVRGFEVSEVSEVALKLRTKA